MTGSKRVLPPCEDTARRRHVTCESLSDWHQPCSCQEEQNDRDTSCFSLSFWGLRRSQLSFAPSTIDTYVTSLTALLCALDLTQSTQLGSGFLKRPAYPGAPKTSEALLDGGLPSFYLAVILERGWSCPRGYGQGIEVCIWIFFAFAAWNCQEMGKKTRATGMRGRSLGVQPLLAWRPPDDLQCPFTAEVQYISCLCPFPHLPLSADTSA